MNRNYYSDQAGGNVLENILQRLDGIGRLEASLAKATSDFNSELHFIKTELNSIKEEKKKDSANITKLEKSI